MGRDVYEASDAARRTFDAADEVLGLALSKLCFEGPEDDLLRTEIQQPAILTTSVALLRALQEQASIRPDFVAGHSLGEYTALVASGSLDFEDAVRVVHARGRFMQEAVPEGHGAMAAVLGCTPEDVDHACQQARAASGKVVSPANYNARLQTVIAGETAAVEVACARALQAGAKRTIPLAVSAPFHCELMAPAAEKLAVELSRVHFADPAPPVVTNVEAEPNADGGRVAELLERQVTAPVRFSELVQKLVQLGVGRVLEVGPGRVLSGLVRRIDTGLDRATLSLFREVPEAARFALGA